LEKGRILALRYDDELPAVCPTVDLLPALDALGQEVARLRRTLLRLGHAQEMFQQRVESEVGRLAREESGGRESRGAVGAVPDAAQQRALLEVDQAVVHLLDLTPGARPGSSGPVPEISPQSVREGLVLLQIRVRNLGRSFGLEPIPAVGLLFDDRFHQVHGVCNDPRLAEGEVAEEVLPGYRLHGRVVRPALVIVNRREDPGELAGERNS
jgi:hypothetical protein